MQSEAELDRRLAAMFSLEVQFVDRADHGLRATQRIAGVAIAGEGRAERRHQSVAEIFVQRAAMPENLALHPLMECRSVPITSVGLRPSE